MLSYSWSYKNDDTICQKSDYEINARSLYKTCRNIGAELLQYDYSLGLGMYDLGAFSITSNKKVIDFIKCCPYYVKDGAVDKISWFVLNIDENIKDDIIYVRSKRHSASIHTKGIPDASL